MTPPNDEKQPESDQKGRIRLPVNFGVYLGSSTMRPTKIEPHSHQKAAQAALPAYKFRIVSLAQLRAEWKQDEPEVHD
jgi:hypothetical protein